MVQTHEKFKLFSRPLNAKQSIAEIAKEIEKWVVEAKAAPKSIGVEYLEGSHGLLISLGYRDDEGACPVKIHSEAIGKIGTKADLATLEKAMGAAAAKHKKVICHELFVTEDKDVHMVIMSQA